MHIVVCIKQVIDPEIPPQVFQIDPVTRKQLRGTQALVVSTFDECALEVALQQKEKTGSKVTALMIAGQEGAETLRHAIAMGADEAIQVTDPAFEDSDSFGKAHILAAALRKLGPFDLVLCGQQAADVEMGLVGPFLAEEMGLPLVALAGNVELAGSKLKVKRPIEGGYATLEAPMPCLMTITNDERNVPRYASIRGIRQAMKRTVPVWSAADLGLEVSEFGPQAARIRIDELFIPQRQVRCELIGGESGEEQAERLALRLRELKLI
jgi:electron transfer flavoprotein beta subunit